MLHISRNVWSLNTEHRARGGLAKFIKNGKQPIQRRIQFLKSDWKESWKLFRTLVHLSETYGLALPRPQRILHFPESDRVVAIIPDCPTIVPDLWPSPFSGVWLERVVGELFRTLVHLSETCGLASPCPLRLLDTDLGQAGHQVHALLAGQQQLS